MAAKQNNSQTVNSPRTSSAKSSSGPSLELPSGNSEDIAPDRLLLDPQNLRLLERADRTISNIDVKLIGQAPLQEQLTKLIANDPLFEIDGLIRSITYSGFLRHERLIVARYDADNYIVLEGNRRLTSVRSLPKQALPPNILATVSTLPCFVLAGEPIDGSQERLNQYRRASEIYIGMRHLMGAKSWEPASRYEFQARLIDEGWKPEEVAERFSRNKSEVQRDLKAQRLYREFTSYEKRVNSQHTLTYNAFAEAARSTPVMTWLGWQSSSSTFKDRQNMETFFHYLKVRLIKQNDLTTDDDAESPRVSAEKLIRRLGEMLKLKDESILVALNERQFEAAEMLFETKREGNFSKRISAFTNALKRVTTDELQTTPKESKKKLIELEVQIQKTIAILDALSK